MAIMEDKSTSEVLVAKSLAETVKRTGERSSVPIEPLKLKVYRRRWLTLIIYMIYTGTNTYQWIEYSIITNVVTRYSHIFPRPTSDLEHPTVNILFLRVSSGITTYPR